MKRFKQMTTQEYKERVIKLSKCTWVRTAVFVQKYGHILMSQANISTLSNDKSLHIIINAILCSEIETFKFKTFVDKINKE